MRLRHLYIAILLLALPTLLVAQISIGGTPPSFAYPDELTTRSDAIEVRSIDLPFTADELREQDAAATPNRRPPRIAENIAVTLDMEHAGVWSTLPSGEQVWRLHIAAPDATALMLYYSNFYIPHGGKLFIYNEDKTHLLGAYTHATHPKQGAFATEFVAGDACILEYVASTESNETPYIDIEEVGYGYTGQELRATGWGTSDNCMVDVNCEEGELWQQEKKGVCRIITKAQGVSLLCSGSLVNNSALDLKPYILTAHHCRRAGYTDDALASDSDLDQWVFYFHYEKSECNSDEEEDPYATNTITGCDVIVDLPLEESSDGMLLLLDYDIPHDYDVYYNGWDRTEAAPESGVCLHHPNGDAMKISTYTEPAESYTFEDDYNLGATDAYWNVVFAETINGHSVTAGGSSGSPLFNENHLIVGTLTGGNSYCSVPEGTNVYGKFSSHWNDSVDANFKRFDLYLNPLGLDITGLNGVSSISHYPSLPLYDGTKESYIACQSNLYTYISDCGVNEVTLTILNPDSATITIDGVESNTIYHSFDTSSYNLYEIVMDTTTYALCIEQSDETLLLQRWDNIISVVNNPSNNGGYYFTHFNWYCDDVLMEGENSSYIYVADDKLGCTYHAQIATQTGVWVTTCNFQFETITTTLAMLLAAPNPVAPLQVVNLKSLLDEEAIQGATVIVTSGTGEILTTQPLTATISTLTAPAQVGIYVVTVITQEGTIHSTKLTVR